MSLQWSKARDVLRGNSADGVGQIHILNPDNIGLIRREVNCVWEHSRNVKKVLLHTELPGGSGNILVQSMLYQDIKLFEVEVEGVERLTWVEHMVLTVQIIRTGS